MSDDTISRKGAIDAFNTNIDELVVSGKENADAVERYINRVIDAIKQLPPAQPERIKSKWALHTYMPHNKFCLACRNDSPYNKRWDFCPNCGAEMGVTE